MSSAAPVNECERRFWEHAVVYDMSTFVLAMPNASHPDGRKGTAYLGRDLKWSTLDPLEAQTFGRVEAERYADHWRGWWRGLGGSVIELRAI